MLNANEVCEIFKITKQTLHNWQKKGLINPIKSGTGTCKRFFTDEEIKACQERMSNNARNKTN